jgi:hypothetical protein
MRVRPRRNLRSVRIVSGARHTATDAGGAGLEGGAPGELGDARLGRGIGDRRHRGRDLLDRPGRDRAAARVGHQDVDRPQPGLDLAAERLDLAEVGRVGHRADRLPPARLDPGADAVDGVPVAAVPGDERSLRREGRSPVSCR